MLKREKRKDNTKKEERKENFMKKRKKQEKKEAVEILEKVQGYEWKEKNEKYLHEIERFLDRVDNVKDERLKESIIYQMLKCDKVLTEISIEMFKDCYLEGWNRAKHV